MSWHHCCELHTETSAVVATSPSIAQYSRTLRTGAPGCMEADWKWRRGRVGGRGRRGEEEGTKGRRREEKGMKWGGGDTEKREEGWVGWEDGGEQEGRASRKMMEMTLTQYCLVYISFLICCIKQMCDLTIMNFLLMMALSMGGSVDDLMHDLCRHANPNTSTTCLPTLPEAHVVDPYKFESDIRTQIRTIRTEIQTVRTEIRMVLTEIRTIRTIQTKICPAPWFQSDQ